ncbi:hypothetical protein EAI_01487 [Harpegnathos saltator]|uniref:Uncharacterized protein n=1 Tax=Harpegnathos saltator TaxID=610380 RepID=E2BPE2_HARSA|nr:hypothetical protein EAI_01487 [Harpegnathos saltator]
MKRIGRTNAFRRHMKPTEFKDGRTYGPATHHTIRRADQQLSFSFPRIEVPQQFRAFGSFHVFGDERPQVGRGASPIHDRMCDRVSKCESRPPAKPGPPRPPVQPRSPASEPDESTIKKRSRDGARPGPPRKECVGRT